MRVHKESKQNVGVFVISLDHYSGIFFEVNENLARSCACMSAGNGNTRAVLPTGMMIFMYCFSVTSRDVLTHIHFSIYFHSEGYKE